MNLDTADFRDETVSQGYSFVILTLDLTVSKGMLAFYPFEIFKYLRISQYPLLWDYKTDVEWEPVMVTWQTE
jgi:hypothetical protein